MDVSITKMHFHEKAIEQSILTFVFKESEDLLLSKNGDLYQFQSDRMTRILVNLETSEIENPLEVFYFELVNGEENAAKFLRISLLELLNTSNFKHHFNEQIRLFLEEAKKDPQFVRMLLRFTKTPSQWEEKMKEKEELTDLFHAIHFQNIDHCIDLALDQKDEELFLFLTNLKKDYEEIIQKEKKK